MSAAHLLIAAAGGLPEAGEANTPALHTRISANLRGFPSDATSSGLDDRRASPDTPATIWALQSADSRNRQPAAAAAGFESAQLSEESGPAAERAPVVHSGSEDEGEGGLRLEDLLAGGSSERAPPVHRVA